MLLARRIAAKRLMEMGKGGGGCERGCKHSVRDA